MYELLATRRARARFDLLRQVEDEIMDSNQKNKKPHGYRFGRLHMKRLCMANDGSAWVTCCTFKGSRSTQYDTPSQTHSIGPTQKERGSIFKFILTFWGPRKEGFVRHMLGQRADLDA